MTKYVCAPTALFVFLLHVSIAWSEKVPCSEDAIYEVLLKCHWTDKTHPTDFPTRNPHFSALCGTVHNEAYTLWTIGGISTPGVREVAEYGSCVTLAEEIASCDEDGNCAADGYFEWDCDYSGSLKSVCQFSGNLTLKTDYRHVSMMSMLAPSPDWNIGIDSANLCRLGKRFFVSEINR